MHDNLFTIPIIPVDPACIAIPMNGRNGPANDFFYVSEQELQRMISDMHFPQLNSPDQ
jgi:hypothetical protein